MSFPALIADCGSTGCEWRLVHSGTTEALPTTAGFNPTYEPSENLIKILQKGVIPNLKTEIKTVWYYGAGCKSASSVAMVAGVLGKVFPNAKIGVESDLLAAARAVYEGKPILCGILGTGSNACFYSGNELTFATPSLGYILGDEGSGNHIGRLLLRAYFYQTMPNDLRELFFEKFKLKLETVLHSVYQADNASGYLASYALFAAENIEHPFIHKLVCGSMRVFLTQLKNGFPQHSSTSLGMVGSIAFYFKRQLEEESQKLGINLSVVLRSPTESLAAYHLAKG